MPASLAQGYILLNALLIFSFAFSDWDLAV